MKSCHSVLWLWTSLACEFICAVGETRAEHGVIDKVEDVVGGKVAEAGDLGSVSLAPQSLVWLEGQAARARNIHV